MKIIHSLLLILSLLLFSNYLLASKGDNPEIRGDSEYVGKFDGFESNVLYLRDSLTGHRISLPLSDEVEYLYKTNNYVPYNPERLIFSATIKVIMVNSLVVQVIVLEVPS